MLKYDEQACLIVVDLQHDFVSSSGALSVPDGEAIIPYVNEEISKMLLAGGGVVFTYDDHPPDHCSFKEQGGQWPPHCVQYTPGAMRPFSVNSLGVGFYKGQDKNEDSYSGFGGKTRQGVGLHSYLQSKNIKTVIVVGLALDYCVKATALDAQKLGYQTMVDLMGTRPVGKETGAQAVDELIDNYVLVLE